MSLLCGESAHRARSRRRRSSAWSSAFLRAYAAVARSRSSISARNVSAACSSGTSRAESELLGATRLSPGVFICAPRGDVSLPGAPTGNMEFARPSVDELAILFRVAGRIAPDIQEGSPRALVAGRAKRRG
jgi:hypothetical protein